MSSKDCFSPEKRSEVMRSVGREDTAAELKLRKALWRAGLRYRKHLRVAGTRPDICFAGRKLAVFVDGCFWHGCPEHYVAPINNAEFWRDKLTRNRSRDERDVLRLDRAGWTVLRFWECGVYGEIETVVGKIMTRVAPK